MKGLIFIPDISGFTNFVKGTDIDAGAAITSELLNDIIDSNPLNLQLSEIEGDAVLFYRIGKPISLKDILAAFRQMFESFNRKYAILKKKYRLDAELSLKLIVHYGNIIEYDIRGFKKLYGETVIESHRLLKNDSTTDNYILITDDYIHALQQDKFSAAVSHSFYRTNSSQLYSGVKKIAYSFFSHRVINANKAVKVLGKKLSVKEPAFAI